MELALILLVVLAGVGVIAYAGFARPAAEAEKDGDAGSGGAV